MLIRAIIRLQACTTNDRQAFVHKAFRRHGTAAGAIGYYQVVGPTWGWIRRCLRDSDIMGHTNVGPNAVQWFEERDDAQDIGEWGGPGLKRLPVGAIQSKWLYEAQKHRGEV